MTPKRDFTVFFPWLHIVILGSIQLSDLLTTRLMYHYHWTYMNLFVAGLMLIVLLIQFTCVKHFRFMRKFSVWYRLAGRDTMGCLISGNRLPLQLRRLVRLVEQPGHPPTDHRDFHHFRNLYLAHDDHSTPISRTKDVDVPPFFAFIGISHFSGSVPRHGARAGGSLFTRK